MSYPSQQDVTTLIKPRSNLLTALINSRSEFMLWKLDTQKFLVQHIAAPMMTTSYTVA